MQVLLVDDEAGLLKTMALLLNNQGYAVETAENGRVALSYLRRNLEAGLPPPDFMIIDLEMPGLTGLGLLDALGREGLRIPTLVITGYGDKQTVVQLLRKGVVDFLDKPFRADEFLDHVRALADKTVQLKQETESSNHLLQTENKNLRQHIAATDGQELLGRMTGGILHDVNNALAIISASAEMLKLAMESGRDAISYANSISEITEKATETLRRIKSLSRNGEGILTCLDLNDLLNATLDLSQSAMGETILVDRCLEEHDGLILGDGVLLQNTFINLFMNARDAMQKGGRLGVKTLCEYQWSESTESEGESLMGWIRVLVSDTGSGMSKETQQKIFEPYFSTKGEKGTGLGLANVKRTLDSHMGHIEVKSEEGKGTTFQLNFPLAALTLSAKAMVSL